MCLLGYALSLKPFEIIVWEVATDLRTGDFKSHRAEVSDLLIEWGDETSCTSICLGRLQSNNASPAVPGDLCCPYKPVQCFS